MVLCWRCLECSLQHLKVSPHQSLPFAWLFSIGRYLEAAATHQCYGGSTALAVNGAFGVQTASSKDLALWRSTAWTAWSLGLARHTLAESRPGTQCLWSPGNPSLWRARTKASLATCQRGCWPGFQTIFDCTGIKLFTSLPANPTWYFSGSLRSLRA